MKTFQFSAFHVVYCTVQKQSAEGKNTADCPDRNHATTARNKQLTAGIIDRKNTDNSRHFQS